MHLWVPTHAADVLRRLEINMFPEIGATPIADLTAPALLAALRKIEHRGAHDLRASGVAGIGTDFPLRHRYRTVRPALARSGQTASK